MGMLMHHTWLEQQKKKAEKPVEEDIPFNEPPTKEEIEAVEAEVEAEKPKTEAKKPKAPAKKPGGRRTVTKK